MDISTRSTLQSNIIRLEKYSKEQLVDIANDRVELAFKPLTVPEETIDLIAELASIEGGNARFAIELLWRAGKYADAEDLGVVLPECVRKAVSSIFALVKKSDLATLSLHEKLFLLGIARFFKENMDRAYASLTEAEKAYAIICEEFNVQPHTHTQLWKYLQNLSTLSIVKKAFQQQVNVEEQHLFTCRERLPTNWKENSPQFLKKKGLTQTVQYNKAHMHLFHHILQWRQKLANCPLCSLDLQNEKIFYQDDSFIVLRTKNPKGHRERIMIVYKRHQHTIPYKAYEHALTILSQIGREVFNYAPKFVILDTTFASINDHWHLVASDLDPKSDDFDQILATRWIKVVDNMYADQT